METGAKTLETEKESFSLGFIMIKGDLGKEVTRNDPSIIPGSRESELKINKWLSASLEEYAKVVCGVIVKIKQVKIIKGLSKEQLVELYGDDHGKWLDSLTKDDYAKHMEVYDGSMSPIVLGIVKVNKARNASEAEEKLIKVRDTLRDDWHDYLGKKEILLSGGSKLFLSAMHVGNYDNDRGFLKKFDLV
ncbi:hypothetical protein COT86_00325 [Candidatus Collierbacteria bacterium CG10_big_fil_rev_8_21_14_0_10_43_36]|uniref:Uncharacterized protein n=1 Tax=Candidatus Collierbacteria bacterium CG10_big_fil_rev_8_21_14_0_10_43_36 TaxID=1974534 RepID=A0A2H0VLY8_9BACT|nr:MAG: hypothetical protein COT86_00325 [Candidatus Collierbacteria bacterium CG10_big_fil_rev_8_21_14_0_10_43_36]